MRRTSKTIVTLHGLTIACVLCLVVGCSTDYKVEVESNTSWSGVFGDKQVNGSGNKFVDLPDNGRQCITVQKNTRNGWIRMRTVNAGDPADAWEWHETGAAYGTVKYCVNL